MIHFLLLFQVLVTAVRAECCCQTESLRAQLDLQTEVLESLRDKLTKLQEQCQGTHGRDQPAARRTRISSCSEIESGQPSGVYEVWPTSRVGLQVWCDTDTDGGGWTVIQRRGPTEKKLLEFYKTWEEYRQGFGNLNESFWIGNDVLSLLTGHNHTVLRVDMWTVEGKQSHAIYKHFKVGPESTNFTLTVDNYSGDAGDSLSYHSGSQFGTWDHYSHPEMRNCAAEFFGGWWYNDCHKVSLNGPYYRGTEQGTKYAAGIHWFDLTGHYNSLVRVRMMIRPLRK